MYALQLSGIVLKKLGTIQYQSNKSEQIWGKGGRDLSTSNCGVKIYQWDKLKKLKCEILIFYPQNFVLLLRCFRPMV